jgi:hypothetical protein
VTRPWSVHPYDIDTFTDLLARLSRARRAVVDSKLHLTYFKEYFGDVGVETLLVEHSYVDRDFLEDYSAYYVRCFKEYPRFCTRIHFFATQFDDTRFGTALEQPDDDFVDELRDAYNGFLVVKPLPETVVGRTCIATYGDDGERRHYPTTRRCKAQLFGIDLEVESLPFQEQDTAVARCATSALWSIFQATAKQFQHSIPTPVEITKAATARAAIRALPNRGLTAHEIASAIKWVGLEPLIVSAKDPDVLRRTAYAYLRAGIPSYLNFELIDINAEPHVVMGRHGVAVTGYSLPPDVDGGDAEFHLRAEHINKLYVHDDGVGPFARIEYEEEPIEWEDEEFAVEGCCWKTSWRSQSAPETLYTAKAAPLNLIIPVYHKIRVPFDAVVDGVEAFDQQLREMREDGVLTTAGQQPKWDIFLSTVTDFKSDVSGSDLRGTYRRALLEETMPRFLWRAIARVGTSRVLEIVFDATDIEQGSFVSRAVEYVPRVGDVLRRTAGTQLDELPPDDAARGIFEWFEQQNRSD